MCGAVATQQLTLMLVASDLLSRPSRHSMNAAMKFCSGAAQTPQMRDHPAAIEFAIMTVFAHDTGNSTLNDTFSHTCQA